VRCQYARLYGEFVTELFTPKDMFADRRTIDGDKWPNPYVCMCTAVATPC